MLLKGTSSQTSVFYHPSATGNKIYHFKKKLCSLGPGVDRPVAPKPFPGPEPVMIIYTYMNELHDRPRMDTESGTAWTHFTFIRVYSHRLNIHNSTAKTETLSNGASSKCLHQH